MTEKNSQPGLQRPQPEPEKALDAPGPAVLCGKEARGHAFAKWMRPTTNTTKAQNSWEEAELESHWMALLAAAEAAEGPALSCAAALEPARTQADVRLGQGTRHLFREQGWALAHPVLSEEALRRIRFLGDTVRNAGWPRVFAYLYEELWALLRNPTCRDALADWLGDGYQQLPGLWFHHVPAVAGARGWGPHVDADRAPHFDEADHPDRLTIWVPLVDVDVSRSCMFVVPTSETPPDLAEKILTAAELPTDLALRWMHAGRPIPCRAGSLVAWRPDVLHWGGIHEGLEGPRWSLSLEFLRAGTRRLPTEELVLHKDQIPDFKTRLYLVARGLLAYGKSTEREPHASTFLSWAESVYRRFAPNPAHRLLR